MDDLQTILNGLEDTHLEYVFQRSRTTSDSAAFQAAGIGRSTFYSWNADVRDHLNGLAQQLKRRAKMRALLVLEDSAEDAARRIVELMHSHNLNVSLNAARDVLDRTTGKPSQAHEVSAPGGGPIVIRWANEVGDHDGDD